MSSPSQPPWTAVLQYPALPVTAADHGRAAALLAHGFRNDHDAVADLVVDTYALGRSVQLLLALASLAAGLVPEEQHEVCAEQAERIAREWAAAEAEGWTPPEREG